MKVWYWKRELKKRYQYYLDLLDNFSCGANLAENISARVYRAKEAVNEAIRKCRELDSTCDLQELQ